MLAVWEGSRDAIYPSLLAPSVALKGGTGAAEVVVMQDRIGIFATMGERHQYLP